MSQTLLLFSKPVYSSKVEINSVKIKQIVDSLEGFNTMFNSIKLDIGKNSLYVLDEYTDLKEKILLEFRKFVKNELHYVNDFQITTSWFSKIAQGESSSWHNHDNSFMSGVLYLNSPKDCGNIVFRNFSDKRLVLECNEYNLLNSSCWAIEPSEGQTIFFPSDVYHMVERNNSNAIRYSLAFNIMPIGIIGEPHMSDTHIRLGKMSKPIKKE